MRIGLSGAATTIDRIIEQAQRAETEGFTSLWYAGAVFGDPLIAITAAARDTSSIELGTSVLQTYPSHPAVMAARATAVAAAIGRPRRFTLGVGPSHQPVIEGMLGLSFDRPGQHTDEYVQILTTLLAGEQASFSGEVFRVNAGPPAVGERIEIPVLVAALGPRLLRVAGQYTSGTITWMANAKAVDEHVAPLIQKAASGAGRPEPRIVVGLPVAVHDDVAEARSAAAEQFVIYGQLPNYQRILERGGVKSPADTAIVGDEASVTAQIEALFAAGATDLWAAPFPVGDDRPASRARTRSLLKELANS